MNCFVYLILLLSCNNYALANNLSLEELKYNTTTSDEFVTFLNTYSNSPTQFWFNKRNSNVTNIIHTGNIQELQESGIDPILQTWFIVHGWHASRNGNGAQNIKNALLANQNVNVIIVDWSHIASKIYTTARLGLIYVATETSMFINFLTSNGFSLNKIHMVGHSLGAHISGLVGKQVTGGSLASITGLDPAAVLFNLKNPYGRLSDSDAQYVEVIHTNAGFYGFLYPIGKTDIYVNGGSNQPTCRGNAACDHANAWDVYVETLINSREYVAFKCANLRDARDEKCPTNGAILRVGGNLPKLWTPGIYALSTR